MAEFCTIYLSSTFQDLKDHRAAVYKSLNQISGVKVIAMEDYVARDDRPLAACLADVAACDIYVGLFAWRYGYIPAEHENPGHLSITELELEAARASGKPRLVFVLQEGAAWPTGFLDSHVGDNDSGARIRQLRKKLHDERLGTDFAGDTATLATAVSNAVSNQLRAFQPERKAGVPAVAHLQREVSHALYLAHHSIDGELAAGIAQELVVGLERSALLSPEALFASEDRQIGLREENLAACHAAAVLVTRASLPGLLAKLDTVTEALQVLRARSGSLALLLSGVAASELPAGWQGDVQVDLGLALPLPADALRAAREWLAARQPPAGYRSVGVPICIVAMTMAELAALQSDPALLNRLSVAEGEQFRNLMKALAAGNAGWNTRYRDTRHGWRPFGASGLSMRRLAEQMAENVGIRGQGRQRQRHVRLQWYPFDCLVADNPRLRPVYRAVARAGCVVLVDEVSLFHPVLRETFQNSPFFNNDQVAIVTISPFDPARGVLDALLEDAARKRLAGAFDRYAVEYDPQCELAVGDERRLKRWLHASLPATLQRLQEPRPDRGALGALAAELGEPQLPPKRDYGWGGGGRP